MALGAKEIQESFVQIFMPEQGDGPDARNENAEKGATLNGVKQVSFPKIPEEEQAEDKDSMEDDEDEEAKLVVVMAVAPNFFPRSSEKRAWCWHHVQACDNPEPSLRAIRLLAPTACTSWKARYGRLKVAEFGPKTLRGGGDPAESTDRQATCLSQ